MVSGESARKHGGRRTPGPGKRFGPPPLPVELKRKKVSLTLPPWLARWLRAQGMPVSEVVETGLIGFYGLEGPEESEADNGQV